MNNKIQKDTSLSSQATYYMFGHISSFFISLLIPVILVRIFSKTDFGLYRQAILIQIFIVRLLQLGIRQSLFFFLPSNPKDKDRYITNSVLILSVVGFVCIVFLTAFRTQIANLFNAPDLVHLLPLISLFVFFTLVSSPFESIFIINSEAKKASFTVFFTQFLRGLITISLILLFRNLYWAIMSLVIYSGIRFIVYMIFILYKYGFKVDKSNITLFRSQMKYSIPMALSEIIGTIAKRFEQFMVSFLFNPSIFAIYSIGIMKVPFVNTVFTTTGEVVMPRIVSLLENDSKADFLCLWNRFITKLSFFGIGVFFFVQLIAKNFISLLYTDSYLDSVIIFRFFSLLIPINMLRYGLILRSLGHTKDVFKSNLFSFITMIIITYPLIKLFGIVGAICASVISYSVNGVSQLVLSSKRLDVSLKDLFPLSIIMKFSIFSCMITVLLFFIQCLINNQLIELIFSTIIYIILYISICMVTRTYNIFKEPIVRNLLHKIRVIQK